MLSTKDSQLKSKLIGLSRKQTLVKIHVTTANDWRRRAALRLLLGARGLAVTPHNNEPVQGQELRSRIYSDYYLRVH